MHFGQAYRPPAGSFPQECRCRSERRATGTTREVAAGIEKRSRQIRPCLDGASSIGISNTFVRGRRPVASPGIMDLLPSAGFWASKAAASGREALQVEARMGWGGPLLTLESLSDITSETILQDFAFPEG